MSLQVDKNGYVYIKVPLWQEVDQRRRPLVSHIKYVPNKVSGKITCVLKTITPVHIGSGVYELATDAGITGYDGIVKGIVKEEGLTVIPGSSLKGVFRSITEAISYSCLLGAGRQLRYQTACEAKHEDSKLCIACGIFGAMGFMGRVSFSKATIMNEADYKSKKAKRQLPKSVEMWPPKDRHPEGRRFYPHIDYLSDAFWKCTNKEEFDITAKRKNKHGNVLERYRTKEEFIETKVVEPCDFIPENVEMVFTLKFENLEDKEIGLVLSGMGIGANNQPIFQPHLGGSKPFCFGTIEVRVKQTYIFYQKDAKAFTSFGKADQVDEFKSDEEVQGWVKRKIEAFLNTSSNEIENLLFQQGFEQIKETLRFPTPLPVTVV